MTDITTYLQAAIDYGASDLHLTVNAPPFLRINGEIILMDEEPLTEDKCRDLVYSALTEDQIAEFEDKWTLCKSFEISDLGYFRIAVYYHRGAVETAIRVGMTQIKTIEELGLPPVVESLTRKTGGLILIAGPTGQGKTTTFNSMLNRINRERRTKIVTIEDPIEFIHQNIRSIIVQQELNTDARTFSDALIHILRQDPDIIGVGEMRDPDTIATALTAAETGHLVLATIHTRSAMMTMNRIIDVFPQRQQAQISQQLSESLVGIISQKLLANAEMTGRVIATEVLVANNAVRNIIRENKPQLLANVISLGKRDGMQTMDDSIRDLYERGMISYETAVLHITDEKYLKTLHRGE